MDASNCATDRTEGRVCSFLADLSEHRYFTAVIGLFLLSSLEQRYDRDGRRDWFPSRFERSDSMRNQSSLSPVVMFAHVSADVMHSSVYAYVHVMNFGPVLSPGRAPVVQAS
jgi:hypothetical protein